MNIVPLKLRSLPLTLLMASILGLSACGDDKSSTNATNPEPAATPTKPASTPTASANVAPAKPVLDPARIATELLAQRPAPIQARNQSIALGFRQAIITEDKAGTSADAFVSLTPQVPGKAQFDGTSRIVFQPDAPLASGQAYNLKLKPQGLLNVPVDTPELDFAFKTKPLELEVQTSGLDPVPDQSAQLQLSGKIFSSDYIEPDQIEKVLQASIQQKPLTIAWEHNDSGTEHRFTVKAIPRETFATDLNLAWDGKAIHAVGAKSNGQKALPVPNIKTFTVTRFETLTDDKDGKPYVSVSFSDPLDPQQDLTGLVQLGSGEVKSQIVGNRLLVYPAAELEPGEHKLILNAGIKAASAELGKLTERSEQTIALEPPKPGVRFVGKGSILPDNQTMEIPLEARGVNAVQITAMEIFPEKIEQFLQVNGLSGDSEAERVGRYIWRKTIPLNAANPNQWNRYSINASDLFKTKPGAMYRLELAIDRRHSTFPCPAGTPAPQIQDKPLPNYDDQDGSSASGWDGISEYYASSENIEYDWDKRDDACTDSYFNYTDSAKATHNFVASNLGLIAKQDATGKVHVIATDLRTAAPSANTTLTLKNFQGQSLATGTTNAEGFAELATPSAPFLLVAQQGADKAYLKVNANTALEVSQFDIGGETISKGLKGVLYGERGVWRPGDDIHLTFALQDRSKTLPPSHPVTVQLFNPKGELKQTLTNRQPTGPFYTFNLKTTEADPTGDWLVKAVLGSSTFNKSLKIETVRPNRLKVDLNYGIPALFGYKPLPDAKLFVQWLHGGTASNLKADVSVRLREKTTAFTTFSDYSFDDPTRKLDSEDQQLLEGRLDNQGYLTFNKSFQPEQPAAGMLSAWFTSRVFEEGGGFSISKQEIDYYPFENYVGIKLPKGDAERNMLLTDTDHIVSIGSLNAEGKEVSLSQVEVTLYKIDWKWWWDKTADSLAEYADSSHSSKLQQSVVTTTNGKGEWKFQIKYPEWGRYLVRACDLQGKHCTGKTLYVDWPGWAGRAQEEGSGAAAMLRFTSDKTHYKVGETAQIQLPESQAGRALLTVETSSEILEQRWIEFNGQRGQVSLPITNAMAPNAYVSISLLQGHQNKQNDRPLRLYGVIPLLVEDPTTKLQPLIQAADEWKPESTQLFKVTEQTGRPMDYTLAVVDEGLLGLTRFQVPDLHKSFYRKEALGIKTWDLFDSVIGAYSGNLERMLAIGGGDEAQVDDAANKPKRFPPVVKFLGAFHLDAGQTREHSVELPSYLGAVRVMLVAAEGSNAYGMTEKSVFVRQPLMLQSSLPRTLKIGESMEVPLTLFVADANLKSVEVKAETDAAFATVGPVVTVPFTQAGEKTATVFIKAGDKPMQGKLRFTATSGDQTSSHEVNIEVQAPNLPSVRTVSSTLDPNGSWKKTITPFGLVGTNQASLELSPIPNLNLEQHLDYLINYPHGCLEQTTSAVFPQLYLPKLIKLEPERQQKVEHFVKRAIAKFSSFQGSNGNLMYWPGSTEANDWASLYAGHFLVEAQKQGYNVPLSMMSALQAYQIRQSQDWTSATTAEDTSAIQAYRLYVLAAAGKPQLGAMNRLRESGKANEQARWLLAAAYQQAGQADAAQQTTAGLVANSLNVPVSEATFSQRLGQLGLQLETLLALQRPQDADLVVQQISAELGDGTKSFNTHDLSWALLSVSHYLTNMKQTVAADYVIDQGAAVALASAQPVLSQLLTANDNAFLLAVNNKGANKLYAALNQRGVAHIGNEQAESQGLHIQAELLDRAGNKIWDAETADPNLKLQQGQDYDLSITVSNGTTQNLKHLALSALVPSGVEISTAASEVAATEPKTEGGTESVAVQPTTPATNGLSYQDVRDDRVLSYFNLAAGSSQNVKIRMNAAYLGKYYFPALSAEAMYQPTTRARTAGLTVSIVKVAPVPVAPAATSAAATPTDTTAVTEPQAAAQPVTATSNTEIAAEEAETDTNPDAVEEDEEATN